MGEIKVSGSIRERAKQSDQRLARWMFHEIRRMRTDARTRERKQREAMVKPKGLDSCLSIFEQLDEVTPNNRALATTHVPPQVSFPMPPRILAKAHVQKSMQSP